MSDLGCCECGKRRDLPVCRAFLAGVVLVVALGAVQLASRAQPPKVQPARFTFQVVQSVNAEYLGDAPAHTGRGSLGAETPDIALDDPVYAGEKKVGMVTKINWDRVKNSVEVEFGPPLNAADPHDKPIHPVRIAVGQEFWIPIGGVYPRKPAKPD
jgi:hypothetical protein